ncbi:hypothetical protein PsalMR5_01144 [Piscirickettsia salmonis]|uniref:hypothetical protein n=1 Tax=Piscirickettsia salmonis TaxID=1238 RepID=UPI0012BA5D0A|nr:hypothetical protein [Piscirickettsia salmonis]QGP53720.1 hypothetical protein PsalSR1_01138 [Piscirickettsia salmonis]QGP60368.1 hypothetical protein PsalBI1_02979 [Piscirickettsia salmonis]QGP63294.1 hypothetical protein PsalMR5_01144 [Piscirickettsia salmonis]
MPDVIERVQQVLNKIEKIKKMNDQDGVSRKSLCLIEKMLKQPGIDLVYLFNSDVENMAQDISGYGDAFSSLGGPLEKDNMDVFERLLQRQNRVRLEIILGCLNNFKKSEKFTKNILDGFKDFEEALSQYSVVETGLDDLVRLIDNTVKPLPPKQVPTIIAEFTLNNNESNLSMKEKNKSEPREDCCSIM